MDFEFVSYQQNKIILISGAVANSYIDSRVQKFQGMPLIISSNGQIVPLNFNGLKTTIRLLTKIFKNKKEQLDAILNELQQSYITRFSNLTKTKIINYLNYKNQKPIIVLWNGHIDKTILNRLGIDELILNLSAYDRLNNGEFDLKLINMVTGQTVVIYKLGTVLKLGRLLSLVETHNILCDITHDDITYAHDPVTDVIFSRCIFNFLASKYSYKTLLEMIINSHNC